MSRALRVRWLGSVPYRDAHALQHGLFDHGRDDWLLLLEHPHVYTHGPNGDLDHMLVDPASVGADLVRTDRGGDVTYHGPGQLVGYPILTVPGKRGGGMADTAEHVRGVEQLVIDVLDDLGLPGASRLRGYPGVWIGADTPEPRKIAAIGVRLSRGRSMHGFALNVHPDLTYFDHIVPCGIADKAVTSLQAEGIDVSMQEVVDAVARRAAERWAPAADGSEMTELASTGAGAGAGAGRPALRAGSEVAAVDPIATVGVWERADVVWRHRPEDLAAFTRGEGPGAVPIDQRAPAPAPVLADPSGGTSVRLRGRLAEAGVAGGHGIAERKPEWMRVKATLGEDYRDVRRTVRSLDLVTVCEEAGCPNISECWADGTATFMINGERCTRACGFCLVDTRHPEALDPDEAQRVAAAVEQMGLSFAVVTAVARDDLADGGAGAFAAVIDAIHLRTPGTSVEVLIPDCKGDPDALATIFAARPEVLNHNIETVARLQRAVRPSAAYARSLSVLARAKAAGLTTKSGIIVGMGETDAEVHQTLADLAGVGVDIVTIGQYLRPTTNHLPVARWVPPATFAAYAEVGEALGIGHVESSPLTRSSYHAKQAAGGSRTPRGWPKLPRS